MVAGQGIFGSLLGLCVAIDPRYLLESDEGGVSNYGTRPDTVAFYGAAFAGCCVLMWRAARRLPTETPGPTGGGETDPTGSAETPGPTGGAEVPSRRGGVEPSARAARRSRLGAAPATRVGVQAVSVLLAAVLLSSFPYKLSPALEELHLAVSVLLYVAELALLVWLTLAGERNLPAVSALALALVGAAVSVASTIGVVRLLMVGEAATAAGFGAGVVLAFYGFAAAAPGS